MWLKDYFSEKSLRRDIVEQKDYIESNTDFKVDQLGRLYQVVTVDETQDVQVVIQLIFLKFEEQLKRLFPNEYPLNGFNVVPEVANLELTEGKQAKGLYLFTMNPVANTKTYIITPQVAWTMRILKYFLITFGVVGGIVAYSIL